MGTDATLSVAHSCSRLYFLSCPLCVPLTLSLTQLSVGHANAPPSDRVNDFKRRIAQVSYFEKKFSNFSTLFEQFDIPTPSIDVEPQPIGGGDVLESVRSYLEPVEVTLAKDVLYSREQRVMLNALQERLHVMHVVSGTPAVSATLTGAAVAAAASRYGSFADRDSEEKAEASELQSLMPSGGADEEHGASLMRQASLSVVPGRARRFFSSHIYGIIPQDKIILFERMIFRISRGNVLIKTRPLERAMPDPQQHGQLISKSVFSLMFVGEQLGKRLRKIVLHFGATEVSTHRQKYH